MLRWILWIVVGLVVLVGLVGLIGLSLPKAHRASRMVKFAAPPDAVFGVLADFAKYQQWRPDVKQVDIEGGGGQGTLVREENKMGTIPYRVEAFEPPSRMVMRIADPKLPFGGTWTYELSADGGGTAMTLTEDGEVYNPVFRFMQKFFFSPYTTIDTYLTNLKKRLGEG